MDWENKKGTENFYGDTHHNIITDNITKEMNNNNNNNNNNNIIVFYRCS